MTPQTIARIFTAMTPRFEAFMNKIILALSFSLLVVAASTLSAATLRETDNFNREWNEVSYRTMDTVATAKIDSVSFTFTKEE
jgi:hypothetical protein